MKVMKIQQGEDDVVGKALDHIVDSFYEPSAKAKASAEIIITYACMVKENMLCAHIDCFLQDLKDEADDRFALDVVDYFLKTIGLESINFEEDGLKFMFDTKENSDRYSDILLHVAAVLYRANERTFIGNIPQDQIIHYATFFR
ncbi:hypothetical protein [Methylomonas methanica]|nr:hypothetical protein [Methylomonas methanica]